MGTPEAVRTSGGSAPPARRQADARLTTTGATQVARASLGKIVRSESHVRYTCQIFGAGEIAQPPAPSDYAFGAFVRVPLRADPPQLGIGAPVATDAFEAPGVTDTVAHGWDGLATDNPSAWAIGLLYDTILLNPAFGALGPRLSNDDQVTLFSPDYLTERAVLVSILLLGVLASPSGTTNGAADITGAIDGATYAVSHGVPPLAPDLGAVVSSVTEGELRAFHYFADPAAGGAATQPYLHMGYLPHAIAQDNPLLPMAILRTIERLERLFPANAALLSIVKRNFAWRLKVMTAG
jgi:hypothetical protein